MSRIKSLVAVLLAVAALGAVTASGAQAQGELTAAEYPATLTGTPHLHALLAWGGLSQTCGQLLLDGNVEAASTTFATSALFTECAMLGMPVTVEMNGCQYGFSITKPVEETEDTYASTVELICPAGKKVVVKWSTCEIQVPPQVGLKEAKFINNTAADDITLQIAAAGIKYEKTKDGLACPLEGTGIQTDGKLTAQLTLAGDSVKTGEGVEVSVQG